MGTVITNLKARFGVDTSDFKKGLKDGDKATSDFQGAAGDTLDKFASMFGVNMSGVTDAIGTANKSLNFLGTSFKGAAKGGEVLTIAMKVLKFALIATGIGAIIVVLGSLIAYFTKSGSGADKFAKIMAQLKSIFNNVIERMVQFGEGMADIFAGRFQEGWQKMRTVFKGLGDEIKEDFKAAGDLADAEDALEDREISLINSLEERRAKVAELRLQAKEAIGDEKTKLSLLKQAEAITKSVYADQVSLEQERLRIMKEKLAIQSKDPTDEQRREMAEQEAKINSLLREQSMELKSISREKNSALKIVNEEIALEKAKTAQIALTNTAISNLKMPDISKAVSAALAPMPKIQKAVKDISVDLTSSLNQAFESIAAGMGEFLGALFTGDAGIRDFGKMIASTFAELAITVGKIAIGAGFAVLGIKKALMSLNPYVAIAAGIALVAIGSAIKGSLASAASGGSGGGSIASSGSFTYDTRSVNPLLNQASKVEINGKLIAEGKDLVFIFNQETSRRGTTT